MSSKTLEGRNEYHRYVTKEHRNIVEVLWDFSSIEGFPLSYFLESVGNTRYREFSIASPDENIEIMVSMIHYTTPLGRSISGVCSNYLEKINTNDHVFAQVCKGRMTVPPNEKPVIFIATGTGLAPLRSVLLSRCKAEAHQNILFFGTRHPLHDFYFKDEILALEQEGKVKAFVAFSQVSEKKYVQDLIKENWEIVVDYLNQDCFVLICGKYRQLVKTVKKALSYCLEKVVSPESAVDFLKNMDKHKRIYSENW